MILLKDNLQSEMFDYLLKHLPNNDDRMLRAIILELFSGFVDSSESFIKPKFSVGQEVWYVSCGVAYQTTILFIVIGGEDDETRYITSNTYKDHILERYLFATEQEAINYLANKQ